MYIISHSFHSSPSGVPRGTRKAVASLYSFSTCFKYISNKELLTKKNKLLFHISKYFYVIGYEDSKYWVDFITCWRLHLDKPRNSILSFEPKWQSKIHNPISRLFIEVEYKQLNIMNSSYQSLKNK